ncbi:MAG: ATP-dependent RecD-like DNA helicase [Planctomycetota bacterium]
MRSPDPRPPQNTAAADEAIVQGTIERVTYHDSETGFAVLQINPEGGFGDPNPTGQVTLLGDRVTATGRAIEPVEGLRVRLIGTWEDHAKHGRRFEFRSWQGLAPLGRRGVERFLASARFPGIGAAWAKKIVDALGADAVARIRADGSVLDAVEGMTPKRRQALAEGVSSELRHQELWSFLLGVGLATWQCEAALATLGPNESEASVRADPYVLMRVHGVGFRTADRAGLALGLAPDHPARLRGAVRYALEQASDGGHVRTAEAGLLSDVRDAIGDVADEDAVRAALADLARMGEVVLEADPDDPESTVQVYLAMHHTSETALARNLAALVAAGPVRAWANPASIQAWEARAGLALHPTQRDAVETLLSNPVALLTGGPGVGKTTITRCVVDLAIDAGAKVLLASPTGRAAKRLAEATGREAGTVHRLLGWEGGEGFAHNATKPLVADLVVVDEVSMLDLVLAHHLVKAIQPPTRVLFIGDPDQLPSVQAGSVLAELLDSGAIPVARLTHVWRQSAGSSIVENAHRILAGERPRLPERDEAGADFFFFPADSDEATADRLVEVVTQRIPRAFGLDWERDVQVLSPMYRGPAGVDRLNERLREALGVGGREPEYRGRVWRVGDRVIQTKNDYDRGVFNGDMGHIQSIDAGGEALIVKFPERELVYERANFIELRPAFAITVHRSQGGEYPAVVLPIVPSQHLLLQRNLLYTAVTRARRLLVLVGSVYALDKALANAEVSVRRSGLGARLRRLLAG